MKSLIDNRGTGDLMRGNALNSRAKTKSPQIKCVKVNGHFSDPNVVEWSSSFLLVCILLLSLLVLALYLREFPFLI